MGKTNSMAEQSAWFRSYEEEVNGARNASNGKKKILLIIPVLLFGGMIAMMINNGALQNEQTKGSVYMLGGVAAFVIILILILTSKSKKTDAAAITRKDLDALFATPQDAAEFDAQIKAEPLFQVVNEKDSRIFITKDYIGTQFKYLGDMTYRFIRKNDYKNLRTIHNNSGTVDVEFHDDSQNILLAWVAKDEGKVSQLTDALEKMQLNQDDF